MKAATRMASPQNQQAECSSALAGAMTALGGALFLMGVLRLLPGWAASHPPSSFDPTPVLACLKLAGWFVTAGWVVERAVVWQAPLRRWLGAAVHRAQTLVKAPADGVLEILIGGVLFIALVLGGMVSLWTHTIH